MALSSWTNWYISIMARENGGAWMDDELQGHSLTAAGCTEMARESQGLVISSPCWSVIDWYGLLITVGVDFSQSGVE